jgi:hypothetical protein
MWMLVLASAVSVAAGAAVGFAAGYVYCAVKYDALIDALEAEPRQIFKLLHTMKDKAP